MDDLEDPHCQSTLYFTSFNMQSLHAPNFQKLANIWEARAPARTASGSKSKPTTWPILRSACEDTQWSGWKRNAETNAGTAGSCSVSPLTSVEMRTGQRIPGLCPCGHPDLRDSHADFSSLSSGILRHCQFFIMFWMPIRDNPYLPTLQI